MTPLATKPRLSVAVVQGGPSTEAEVSRASAAGVAKALVEAGHAVVRLELDAYLSESIRSGGYDVVFPVAHGAVGEDGSLQGLLEVIDVPYVGSGVLASALAMEKRLARRIFESAGLPVARGISAARGDRDGARDAAERARREVGARLVVKPSSQGSAIGVGRFDDKASIKEIAEAIEAAWAIDAWVLVEHFARGREMTCSVHESDDGTRSLGIAEILTPSDSFFSYEARYTPGRSVHVYDPACPSDPDAIASRLPSIATRAHQALGCRDLSRVDFIFGDDDDAAAITLLEVNTMPGFTPTSLYPETAEKRGISFAALCDGFVRRAHARGSNRRNAPRPLPGK